MKQQVKVVVNPTLADYLATRLKNDEKLLQERQNALGKDEQTIWQYLQGKRDMGKQVLLYLEEIQQSPNMEIEAALPNLPQPTPHSTQTRQVFHYPDDYDRNE